MIHRTAQPLLFTQLLSYWSVDSVMSQKDAGFYALAMLGLNFVSIMCQHHNSLFVMRFSMKVKVACSSLLYRKVRFRYIMLLPVYYTYTYIDFIRDTPN